MIYKISKWAVIVMGAFTLFGVVKLRATGFELISKMVGEGVYNYFGASVASAGDVNGDGYDDVIIGAYGYSNSGSGAAYIFFGGPSMDTLYDVKMVGDLWGMGLGEVVASAGDVNGDGYDDVVVGAESFDTAGATGLGAAYIYLGGSTFDTIYCARIVGEEQDNHLGGSVSSAGDVDGDGHDDIIVGAATYDLTPYGSEGAAYVYRLNATLIGENPHFGEGMQLNVTPNITRDQLQLNFYISEKNKYSKHVKVDIVDATGRVKLSIYKGTLSSGFYKTKVDLNGIPDGVYFAVLRINGTYVASKKFQIVR